MVYRLLRPVLFQVDPERAHELAMGRLETLDRSPRLLEIVGKHFRVDDPRLRTKVWDLAFPSPIGIAAGFDKNARAPSALAALGFGFVEVGTVTALPQEGNPKPRIFRIPESRALVNRLGFNNEGKDAIAARLAKAGRPPVPLGVNIGKSRATPIERAVEDYVASFEALEPYADYAVVNVSSPNTPGLRELQGRDHLARLVSALSDRAQALARVRGSDPVPLLVKVAPDLDDRQLEEVLDVVRAEDVAGVVATNTTIGRPGVDSPVAMEAGGLSGAPLKPRALEIVRRVHSAIGRGTPVVGVGGILTGDDAYDFIRAGASLVQIYTGFIYGGWNSARDVGMRLAERLEEDGFATVADAVGADAK